MIGLITDINRLMRDADFRTIILKVENFFQSFPEYKNENYHSFANFFEKELYERYIGSLDDSKLLPKDHNLEQVYFIYAISLLRTGRLTEAKENLILANRINPISSQILLLLSEL